MRESWPPRVSARLFFHFAILLEPLEKIQPGDQYQFYCLGLISRWFHVGLIIWASLLLYSLVLLFLVATDGIV